MTDTYFQLRYIQTSSRNAVDKKLFLTSLLFLARSYRAPEADFSHQLRKKIANCDIGDRQRDPCNCSSQ
jgi:hypothetical protein